MNRYLLCYTVLLLFFTVICTEKPMKADIEIPFEIPDVGCPMAHADRNMSDNCFLPVPKQNVGIVWHSQKLASERAGSTGLGFSGNGRIVACTYQGIRDNLVIYDYDGNILWSSGFLLGPVSFTSAPIVDAHDRVIACDKNKIILVDPFDYDSDGKILEWEALIPSKGITISPVITEDSIIVLATKNGPLYAFNSSDGTLIAYKFLQPFDKNDKPLTKLMRIHAFYETTNTPCVKGNRVYVLGQFTTGGVFSLYRQFSSLIAIDIHPEKPAGEKITIAWHYDYSGPSGGSPLLINDTIYFDSKRLTEFSGENPQARAIIDKGNSYQVKWVKSIPNVVLGSFAKDPRQSFWIIDNSGSKLYRTSIETGKIVEQVDVDGLVNETGKHLPSSVITICENTTRPILILGVKAIYSTSFSSYIIAIDLTNNNSLLWKVKIAEGSLAKLDFSFGQFPVVVKGNESRIFFSTIRGGPWAIGERS